MSTGAHSRIAGAHHGRCAHGRAQSAARRAARSRAARASLAAAAACTSWALRTAVEAATAPPGSAPIIPVISLTSRCKFRKTLSAGGQGQARCAWLLGNTHKDACSVKQLQPRLRMQADMRICMQQLERRPPGRCAWHPACASSCAARDPPWLPELTQLLPLRRCLRRCHLCCSLPLQAHIGLAVACERTLLQNAPDSNSVKHQQQDR